MSREYFQFKEFRIRQKQSAMRVGTDGILLGAWADVRGDERRILDIGSGTGLLTLMMAQRNQEVHIDSIEIEPMAAEEAQFNAENSPWADRIQVHCSSIQDYVKANPLPYDLIISNPPYFIDSPHNSKLARTTARHASLLPYSELAECVAKLLTTQGRFFAIFPYEEAKIFNLHAEQHLLHCNRRLNVYPVEGRSVKRVAAEFSFSRTDIVEEDLIISIASQEEYTEQYRKITSGFYQKF